MATDTTVSTGLGTDEGDAAPLAGALAGAVAWLVGYVVTYALYGSDIQASLRGLNAAVDFFGGTPVPTWKAVGWLHFSAQFVTTEITGLPGGPETVNLVAESDAVSAALYLLPVVLLVGAAFVAAYFTDARSPRDGAVTGAASVIGYGVLSVVMVFLTSHAFGGGVTAGVTLVTGILLAGVVYPLVLGGVGGVLASALRD